ncbi:basic proline-rich protein-like [Paramacrobiotus metropolitanus]|uniref:basic proline-rich protein-like n=1 Tax=Paramacrobiotus metropolitanus TaxID=2943436 RepID=UPI0024460EF6|nr:basic proline-rich protein-like [Paramacrobiotus metropolitanus]
MSLNNKASKSWEFDRPKQPCSGYRLALGALASVPPHSPRHETPTARTAVRQATILGGPVSPLRRARSRSRSRSPSPTGPPRPAPNAPVAGRASTAGRPPPSAPTPSPSEHASFYPAQQSGGGNAGAGVLGDQGMRMTSGYPPGSGPGPQPLRSTPMEPFPVAQVDNRSDPFPGHPGSSQPTDAVQVVQRHSSLRPRTPGTDVHQNPAGRGPPRMETQAAPSSSGYFQFGRAFGGPSPTSAPPPPTRFFPDIRGQIRPYPASAHPPIMLVTQGTPRPPEPPPPGVILGGPPVPPPFLWAPPAMPPLMWPPPALPLFQWALLPNLRGPPAAPPILRGPPAAPPILRGPPAAPPILRGPPAAPPILRGQPVQGRMQGAPPGGLPPGAGGGARQRLPGVQPPANPAVPGGPLELPRQDLEFQINEQEAADFLMDRNRHVNELIQRFRLHVLDDQIGQITAPNLWFPTESGLFRIRIQPLPGLRDIPKAMGNKRQTFNNEGNGISYLQPNAIVDERLYQNSVACLLFC